MIEGLTATWVTNTETFKEFELREVIPADQPNGHVPARDETDHTGLVLSVILVVGPPDPNALSYLVPRSVFERELPVHVGALSTPTASSNTADDEILNAMLDILEVMNPHDIVVFICDSALTVDAAVNLMAP